MANTLKEKLAWIDYLSSNYPIKDYAAYNAKSITTALCALGIEHSICANSIDPEGGIQFEFNQAAIEIRCLNSGYVETEEFEEEIIPICSYVNSAAPGCTNHHSVEPHTCPYAEEINNDNTTLCQCCSACEHECAQDI